MHEGVIRLLIDRSNRKRKKFLSNTVKIGHFDWWIILTYESSAKSCLRIILARTNNASPNHFYFKAEIRGLDQEEREIFAHEIKHLPASRSVDYITYRDTANATLEVKVTVYTLEEAFNYLHKRTANFTLKRIRNIFSDDQDISTSNMKVSLLCPLSKAKMKWPCRSTKCDHLQVFDAEFFLKLNKDKEMSEWMCPLCDKSIELSDLVIDGYFMQITDSNDDLDEICLKKDGSWCRSPVVDQQNQVDLTDADESQVDNSDNKTAQEDDDVIIIDKEENNKKRKVSSDNTTGLGNKRFASSEKQKKPFKLCNRDLSVKKLILVEGIEDLKQKGKIKLGYDKDLDVKIELEDGTEIDDDECLFSRKDDTVLVLTYEDQHKEREKRDLRSKSGSRSRSRSSSSNRSSRSQSITRSRSRSSNASYKWRSISPFKSMSSPRARSKSGSRSRSRSPSINRSLLRSKSSSRSRSASESRYVSWSWNRSKSRSSSKSGSPSRAKSRSRSAASSRSRSGTRSPSKSRLAASRSRPASSRSRSRTRSPSRSRSASSSRSRSTSRTRSAASSRPISPYWSFKERKFDYRSPSRSASPALSD